MHPEYIHSNFSRSSFQHLEDMATGYWHSEVLFLAIEIELFDYIEQGNDSVELLADASCCKADELARLLNAMEQLGLVMISDKILINSQMARQFLVSESPSHMGDFLLYRKYLVPKWQNMRKRIHQCPPYLNL